MKRFVAWVVLAVVAIVSAAGCAHRPEAGWVTLIDGDKGLDNFDRIGDANWRTEGGLVVADKGKGGQLVTRNSYKDFEIYAEFWADVSTNSGIFIRATNPKNIGSANAYEVNIYDRRPGPEYATGAIVDFASVKPGAFKAGGQWNVFEIYAKGDLVTVKLNGQLTAQMTNDKFKQGPFSLQFGNGPDNAPGGPIKWRKVLVRAL